MPSSDRCERCAEGVAKDAPILGFTTLDRAGLDLESLRSIGVTGLLDKSCIPEHIIFRANQLVRTPSERRHYERAPTFLSIDLIAGEDTTSEYALSLSLGGMRITSTRRIEPNTDVRVRFQLPHAPDETIEAGGRVIYSRSQPRAAAPWEIGVFFYPLDERSEAQIDREVKRLLAASSG